MRISIFSISISIHLLFFTHYTVTPPPQVFAPVKVGTEYVYDLEKGRRYYITPVAIGQVDPKTAEQDVFFELNGAPKRLTVKNKSSAATVITRQKADPALKNQVLVFSV